MERYRKPVDYFWSMWNDMHSEWNLYLWPASDDGKPDKICMDFEKRMNELDNVAYAVQCEMRMECENS